MKRVGFVINSRLPRLAAMRGGMLPHHLLTGWDDAGSPMSFMRFRWVAEEVNRTGRLRYELYKPWRRYDAVVFLKSMGAACEAKMRGLQADGVRVVFEANVDYYTRAPVSNLPGDLAPTEKQRETALAMTSGADGVIASSRRLGEICKDFQERVKAVPDNIPPRLVPGGNPRSVTAPLNLWWSGMAAKMYDFLLIERVLLARSKHLHLNFVTGDIQAALERWSPPEAARLRSLLEKVPHTIHRYSGIPELLRLYHSAGGVIVSPRFLDSPYNHSHTEWKLTLGLACGLSGLGSPLPSYIDAAAVGGGSLRICESEEDWATALDEILAAPGGAAERGALGRRAILDTYGTPRVASEHADFVAGLLA